MFLVVAEVLRACTYLVNNGKIMYWGTSRWSPFELFEAYTKAKEYGVISPIVEIGEYHWFHREKVELYMAELYNKIGEKRFRNCCVCKSFSVYK